MGVQYAADAWWCAIRLAACYGYGYVTRPNSGDRGVTRPNSGDVTRPNTGDLTRPNTGGVTRLDSGDVTRTNSGDVTRRLLPQQPLVIHGALL